MKKLFQHVVVEAEVKGAVEKSKSETMKLFKGGGDKPLHARPKRIVQEGNKSKPRCGFESRRPSRVPLYLRVFEWGVAERHSAAIRLKLLCLVNS